MLWCFKFDFVDRTPGFACVVFDVMRVYKRALCVLRFGSDGGVFYARCVCVLSLELLGRFIRLR